MSSLVVGGAYEMHSLHFHGRYKIKILKAIKKVESMESNDIGYVFYLPAVDRRHKKLLIYDSLYNCFYFYRTEIELKRLEDK